MMVKTCKNCDSDITANCLYCPACGQKTALHRLTAHDIVHEGIHYFTHADKGIFLLIRDLAIKRGAVARDYIDGRRKKYFPPLSFYMLVAAVLVFSMTLDQPAERIDVVTQRPELSAITDPVAKEAVIAQLTRKYNVQYYTSQYSNIFALMALPLTALIFWLFYRKAKYNFIEHLVAGMYMLGFCLLCNALIILPIAHFTGLKGAGTLLFFLLQLVYFSIFYSEFLCKTKSTEKIKAVLVTVTALAVWVLFTGSLIYTYITNGLWGIL